MRTTSELRFFLLLGLLKLLLVLAFGNFLLPLHRGLPRPRGERKTDDADLHSAVQLWQLTLYKRHGHCGGGRKAR
jgi:hypothetical protein